MEVSQRMSAPMQASSQLGMHDIVFHVIYGSDTSSTLEFVHASAVRLHSITQCSFLAGMMDRIVRDSRDDHASQQQGGASSCTPQQQVPCSAGPDVIKALFFLFLNVDMVLKNYVCMPSSIEAFAEAMNVRMPKRQQLQDQHQLLCRMHAWSMIGTRRMDTAKARRFFAALHDDVVRKWLQDERLHARDLVRMVKEEYFVS